MEDDAPLADVVVAGLRDEHLAVDWADSYESAVEYLISGEYDVACLDLGLPDGDGLELCRRLLEDGTLRRPTRVLMLTARDAVSDRVAGLDAGADDYLVKPFSLSELAARLRALSRRHDHAPDRLQVGDLVVEVATLRASRGGRNLILTSREFSVLRYLCSRPGEVISAEELLEHCWDANVNPFTGSVGVILGRLRRKLGEPSPIETIRGAGYRVVET